MKNKKSKKKPPQKTSALSSDQVFLALQGKKSVKCANSWCRGRFITELHKSDFIFCQNCSTISLKAKARTEHFRNSIFDGHVTHNPVPQNIQRRRDLLAKRILKANAK
jgi:hypothetical protein